MSDGGLNVARLSDWMNQHRPGPADAARPAGPAGLVRGLRGLAGGTQNRLFAFWHGSQRFVLRLPPARSGAAGDAVILREARLLGRLSATAVPHSRLLAAEPDPALLGAAFYVSSYVAGWAVTDPGLGRVLGPGSQAAITGGLARALAALGEIDPAALGLDGFGRPAGFLARQVDRWLRQLDSYRGYPGYGHHRLPHIEALSGWLRARLPSPQRPGIMHGDLHLGNVLVDPDGRDVAALIDWELATVGDPLLDLGELIATWPGQDGRSALGRSATPAYGGGWPSGQDLVGAYQAASSRDLTALNWYVVLAGFRLAILLEGSRARALTGQGSPEVADELHQAAVTLLRDAARRTGSRHAHQHRGP
jgi:aminoglycoside phosphotransferase (APT) family kinase protein